MWRRFPGCPHWPPAPKVPILTFCLLVLQSFTDHLPAQNWNGFQYRAFLQPSGPRPGQFGLHGDIGCHDSGGDPVISWVEVSHAATHPTAYHMAPQTKTEVKSPCCHQSQPHGQRRLLSRDRKVESALPAATLTPWCPAGYFVLCESQASWSVKWTCNEQTRKYYIYEALAKLSLKFIVETILSSPEMYPKIQSPASCYFLRAFSPLLIALRLQMLYGSMSQTPAPRVLEALWINSRTFPT